MPNYEVLSQALAGQIMEEKASGSYAKVGFDDQKIVRRNAISSDYATVWRPAFVHDIDKIIHCPYYNRYSDKTQVFSLIRNDDITRRSLHVQLVSRIARTIGSALNLNLDLIEAIALGHDIGHPPFAHYGETVLDELYFANTGRHFSHNIHSVRVLDEIFPMNISLQVLDGIACHNGEVVLDQCHASAINDFDDFDAMIEAAYIDQNHILNLKPSTLEGAVVRISDVIAYIGKDRQDAARVNKVGETDYDPTLIGSINAEFINNLVVNIIENSYGKPYIRMDQEHFKALKIARDENVSRIYMNAASWSSLQTTVKPMMEEIYYKMLEDLRQNNTSSPIFCHHVDYVSQSHYTRRKPYLDSDPHQIVVDYIASMTDDYMIELHHHLFPDSCYKVSYVGYFDS